MIKFENGLVNISGKGIDILSEYAVITHEIKEMFVKNGGEEKEIKEKQTGPGIRCTNAWMKKVCFRADRLRHSEALHGKEE